MLKKLEKIRSKINSRYVQAFIIGLAVFITILSSLPYFNLVLSEQVVFLLFFFMLAWVFKFPFRYIFGVSLAFIVFSVILLLFSQEGLAERFGNYAFLFLLVGLANMLIEIYKEK